MYPYNLTHKQIDLILKMYLEYIDISKDLIWCYAGENKIWCLYENKWITLDLKEILINFKFSLDKHNPSGIIDNS